MAKDKYIGRYRLGLNSIIITNSSSFQIKVLYFYRSNFIFQRYK